MFSIIKIIAKYPHFYKNPGKLISLTGLRERERRERERERDIRERERERERDLRERSERERVRERERETASKLIKDLKGVKKYYSV